MIIAARMILMGIGIKEHDGFLAGIESNRQWRIRQANTAIEEN